MRAAPASAERAQTRGEEIANATSHGIALVAALIGTPVLIVQAARSGGPGFVVGASLFCAAMLMLYLASTTYHALPVGRVKRAFRVIDHCAIFLLIAGTYTPFTLGVLYGTWGWVLFGVVWGLAALGIALKTLVKTPHPISSAMMYLLMGWVVVIALDPLLVRMPASGLYWLLAGGLSYTAGVILFAADSKLRYAHLAWHLFVVAGTACHYLAVLWYGAGASA